MDYLNSFLEKLWLNTDYGAERLENMAEIYIGNEPIPACLIELKDNIFYTKFRIGMSSMTVARITHAISIISTNLFIEDDFYIHPQYGYMYGDNARGEYIRSIESNFIEEKEISDGAFFVSKSPIYACGK